MSDASSFAPAATAARQKMRRLGWWGSAGACGVLAVWGWQWQSRASTELPKHTPLAAQLRVQLPEDLTEGQAATFTLGWQDLPPGVQVQAVPLTLRWQDRSYAGEGMARQQAVSLGAAHQQVRLVFQSAGSHRVEVLGPDGRNWASLAREIKPFVATVFPKQWEAHRDLVRDPARFHLWVNLHFDPKAPQRQRQYVQVTYDGEIIDRWLVSSGAAGHSTPTGRFKLGFQEEYPRSARYNNTPMPFWSAINVNGNQGEYGFHALEDGGYHYLLGQPASHGCIRLSRQPSLETDPQTGKSWWGDRGGARWIYDRVPPETPVTLFRQSLPAFHFEDYSAYLSRQAG
ncbi:MAG: L,D-transpeptidase [Candidatus Sericytochromatia bacterium]